MDSVTWKRVKQTSWTTESYGCTAVVMEYTVHDDAVQLCFTVGTSSLFLKARVPGTHYLLGRKARARVCACAVSDLAVPQPLHFALFPRSLTPILPSL